MVSTYFKFISEDYFKLYLPVNRLGKNRGEDVVMLVVIWLVCE